MDLQKCPLTNEEKKSMIADAAFLKSQKQEFPGDPVKDWLGAESEIEDALAKNCRSADQKHELSAHQRIRAEVRRILEKTEETINAETVRQTLEKVTKQFQQVGEFFPETIDRASKAVKHEITSAVDKLGYNWDNFRIKQSELFASWKDRKIHSLNQTSKSVHTWVSRWRNRNDA